MDGKRFDRIVQMLAAAGSRRGLLRLLAALPVVGAPFSILDEMETEAAKRRKRHKPRKRPQQANHARDLTAEKKKGKNRKKKKRKKCKPQSNALTCADQCGIVQDNCKRPVDCGPCGCEPPCQVCFTCDTDTLTCTPDPDSVGEPCGDGQVCQSDGACACSGDSCGDCRTCEANGVCQGCTGCCDDGQCVATCADGCCSNGTCQPGTSNTACGEVGATCQSCVNPTPVCVNHECDVCTSTTQCPPGQRCDGGNCVPCDVCHGGLCTYSTIEAATSDLNGPTTIHICPGTYTGSLAIFRNGFIPLTLIGEGQGDGPGDTILSGGGVARTIRIHDFERVTLRNLRITGGSSQNGGGIYTLGAESVTVIDCTITGNTANRGGAIEHHSVPDKMLTLTRCTVSGNTSTDPGDAGPGFGDGGGIWTNSPMTLTDCTVSGNTADHRGGGIFHQTFGSNTITLQNTDVTGNTAENTATSGGGIFNSAAVTVVLADGSSVSGNTPNNCRGPGTYDDPDGACAA